MSSLLVKRIEDTKSEYATKNTIHNTKTNQQDDIIHNLNEIFDYIE